MKEGQTELNK